MCFKHGKVNLDWKSGLPQKEGDYLWVEQWSCGCVMRCGIAWVFESCEDGFGGHGYRYKTDSDKWMEISWEGQSKPYHDHDGVPKPNFWCKVDLPKPE